MKMASRLIDLISKKPNFTCSTLFLLIFPRAARFFVFPLPLFFTTTTLFCTTETSNFLVTHYFYGEIVVCAYPIFWFQCDSKFSVHVKNKLIKANKSLHILTILGKKLVLNLRLTLCALSFITRLVFKYELAM